MTYTAVIRQRGQLTVPDQVREILSWLQTGSVVGIEVNDDELRVIPHTKMGKPVDWDAFFSKVHLARSLRGKRGNLSSVITEDRESH
ncbi:AbrB/MazE/SpoVT family DNA-binding domain-containing protein [Candidatus Gottesmanbacteria bacterium]|nr:AbrB/MazE/SpoVT family DNA-binding domain-containing protein [Candidatus Gottesmanbacteria bacterium]